MVLKVDNTAPSSQIAQPVGGANLTGTTATITGTAGDNVSGLARVEVSTDGGASWSSASGTAVWSFTWTLPSDGTYTLRSRAVDLAGCLATARYLLVLPHTDTAGANILLERLRELATFDAADRHLLSALCFSPKGSYLAATTESVTTRRPSNACALGPTSGARRA